MRTKRWALFLSGRGSTAQSVLDVLPHLDIAMVVSSRTDAGGLQRARRMGIPQLVLPRAIDWTKLHQELCSRRVTHLFLLGFMRLLPADFVQDWQGRIMNVHPSLLPAFPGAHAIRESYLAGKPMGVTIHDVIAEMDAGTRRLQGHLPRQQELPAVNTVEVPAAVGRNIALMEQRLIRHWVDR